MLFITDEITTSYIGHSVLPNFIHRNWFRDKLTLQTLEQIITNKEFNKKILRDKFNF